MNVPSSRSCVGELVVARAADDVAARVRDLGERQPLGAAHDRDDEPLRRGDGDADVRRRELQQRVLGVLHVDVAVAHERLRADLREQVGDRDAHVRVQLARTRDELVRARHVGGDRQLEDRRLPGGGQAARDRLADVRQRDRLDLAASELQPAPAASGLRRARRPRRRSGPRGRCRAADARSMPLLARDPARERRGLHAAAVARLAQNRRCLGGLRRCRRTGHGVSTPFRFGCSGAASGLFDLLAGLADPRDRLADRRLALPASAIFSSTPAKSASTSCVTLSVSTSNSGSPFSTVSPSDFSHLRDRAGFHALAQARELDLVRHGYFADRALDRGEHVVRRAGRRTAPSPARTRAARTSRRRARSARRGSRTPCTAAPPPPRRRSPCA